MGRKKTKKKKMKGGVNVNQLVTNLLQCGGLLSFAIKPLETNEFTKIAGYLDSIEADTYNSDEYWILLALTGGLSNCNRFINTRIKTYFRIQNILDKDEIDIDKDVLEKALVLYQKLLKNDLEQSSDNARGYIYKYIDDITDQIENSKVKFFFHAQSVV